MFYLITNSLNFTENLDILQITSLYTLYILY